MHQEKQIKLVNQEKKRDIIASPTPISMGLGEQKGKFVPVLK
jgi:hypothetical protein